MLLLVAAAGWVPSLPRGCVAAAATPRARTPLAEDEWEMDDWVDAEDALARYQAYGFFDAAGLPIKRRLGLLDQSVSAKEQAEEEDDDDMTTERMLVRVAPVCCLPTADARCAPSHLAGAVQETGGQAAFPPRGWAGGRWQRCRGRTRELH